MIVRPESDVNSQRQGPSRVRTIRPLHALWLSKLTQGLSQGNMQPALSQDSDDLYGPPELDSVMAWELAEMEGLLAGPSGQWTIGQTILHLINARVPVVQIL